MGRLKGKISIREAERRKRVAILSSPAFAKWFSHRIKESPRPSDPYRAYMIDLSLRAPKPTKDGQWEKEPNRMDLSQIDTPMFSDIEHPVFMPAPKPKGGKRGDRPPQKKGVTYAVPEPKTPHGREITHLIDSSTAKFGLPAPVINVTQEQAYTGNSFFRPSRNLTTGAFNGGLIQTGGKGQRGVAVAAAAHETGHYIHILAKPEVLQREGHKAAFNYRAYQGETMENKAQTFAMEATATRIGKKLPAFQKLPDKDKAVGSWALRVWLETYRKRAWYERDPVDPSKRVMKFGETKFPKGMEKKYLGE